MNYEMDLQFNNLIILINKLRKKNIFNEKQSYLEEKSKVKKCEWVYAVCGVIGVWRVSVMQSNLQTNAYSDFHEHENVYELRLECSEIQCTIDIQLPIRNFQFFIHESDNFSQLCLVSYCFVYLNWWNADTLTYGIAV